MSPAPAPAATIVIFGGSGDLARRKLVPALFELHRQGLLAKETAIVGFARSVGSDEEWRDELAAALDEHGRGGGDAEEARRSFASRLHAVRGDLRSDASYAELKERLAAIEAERGLTGNRLYYLAIPPSGIGDAARRLGAAGLVHPVEGDGPFSRLVVEKPFGHDLASAHALNEAVHASFRERQVFRIDHYLGKETTQNILVFRLGNGIFEPLWNRRYVDHVQITVAETIGVEGRGKFFEEAGIFRDVVQNHLLQLLCLVAMEPPVAFEANVVRDEKVKVLRSVRPPSREEVLRDTVRGQYAAGAVSGRAVAGYRDEPDVAVASTRETYAAWKLQIENWRWAGVPFYLRAGKRLPKRVTEIAITFKTPPIALFRHAGCAVGEPNVLILRIQPDEGIALRIGAKRPGPTMRVETVKMDFRYAEHFGEATPDAYERLLVDALHGDGTLFARRDEVEAAWELVEGVLDVWAESPPGDLPNYEAGTWGPEAATELLARDGRRWRRP